MRLNPVCESVKVVDLLEDVALPTAQKVAMRPGVLPGRDDLLETAPMCSMTVIQTAICDESPCPIQLALFDCGRGCCQNQR